MNRYRKNERLRRALPGNSVGSPDKGRSLRAITPHLLQAQRLFGDSRPGKPLETSIEILRNEIGWPVPNDVCRGVSAGTGSNSRTPNSLDQRVALEFSGRAPVIFRRFHAINAASFGSEQLPFHATIDRTPAFSQSVRKSRRYSFTRVMRSENAPWDACPSHRLHRETSESISSTDSV